jgi:hypothetical protein
MQDGDVVSDRRLWVGCYLWLWWCEPYFYRLFACPHVRARGTAEAMGVCSIHCKCWHWMQQLGRRQEKKISLLWCLMHHLGWIWWHRHTSSELWTSMIWKFVRGLEMCGGQNILRTDDPTMNSTTDSNLDHFSLLQSAKPSHWVDRHLKHHLRSFTSSDLYYNHATIVVTTVLQIS